MGLIFFMSKLLSTFIDYLFLEKKYAKNTVMAYQKDISDFSNFIKETFDDLSLVDVHYVQIRRWIIALSSQNLSNLSINRKIASLKAFYLFLLKTKTINVNPLAKHQALKTDKKIQIPFSEKEMFALISQFENEDDDFELNRNNLIFQLFYYTGMRRSELINLKIKDIDFANKTLKVLGKRNKERLIPMMPELIVSLKKYMALRKNFLGVSQVDELLVSKKHVKISESFVYHTIKSYLYAVTEKSKKKPTHA